MVVEIILKRVGIRSQIHRKQVVNSKIISLTIKKISEI